MSLESSGNTKLQGLNAPSNSNKDFERAISELSLNIQRMSRSIDRSNYHGSQREHSQGLEYAPRDNAYSDFEAERNVWFNSQHSPAQWESTMAQHQEGFDTFFDSLGGFKDNFLAGAFEAIDATLNPGDVFNVYAGNSDEDGFGGDRFFRRWAEDARRHGERYNKIYMEEGDDSFFSGEFWANQFSNWGYSAGIVGEALLEQAAMAALLKVTGGASAAGMAASKAKTALLLGRILKYGSKAPAFLGKPLVTSTLSALKETYINALETQEVTYNELVAKGVDPQEAMAAATRAATSHARTEIGPVIAFNALQWGAIRGFSLKPINNARNPFSLSAGKPNYGGVSNIIETVLPNVTSRIANPVGKRAADLTMQMLSEGGEEVWQGGNSNYFKYRALKEYGLTEEGKDWDDYVFDGNLVDAFIGGAFGGAMFYGMGKMSNKALEFANRNTRKAQREEREQLLSQMEHSYQSLGNKIKELGENPSEDKVSQIRRTVNHHNVKAAITFDYKFQTTDGFDSYIATLDNIEAAIREGNQKALEDYGVDPSTSADDIAQMKEQAKRYRLDLIEEYNTTDDDFGITIDQLDRRFALSEHDFHINRAQSKINALRNKHLIPEESSDEDTKFKKAYQRAEELRRKDLSSRVEELSNDQEYMKLLSEQIELENERRRENGEEALTEDQAKEVVEGILLEDAEKKEPSLSDEEKSELSELENQMSEYRNGRDSSRVKAMEDYVSEGGLAEEEFLDYAKKNRARIEKEYLEFKDKKKQREYRDELNKANQEKLDQKIKEIQDNPNLSNKEKRHRIREIKGQKQSLLGKIKDWIEKRESKTRVERASEDIDNQKDLNPETAEVLPESTDDIPTEVKQQVLERVMSQPTEKSPEELVQMSVEEFVSYFTGLHTMPKVQENMLRKHVEMLHLNLGPEIFPYILNLGKHPKTNAPIIGIEYFSKEESGKVVNYLIDSPLSQQERSGLGFPISTILIGHSRERIPGTQYSLLSEMLQGSDPEYVSAYSQENFEDELEDKIKSHQKYDSEFKAWLLENNLPNNFLGVDELLDLLMMNPALSVNAFEATIISSGQGNGTIVVGLKSPSEFDITAYDIDGGVVPGIPEFQIINGEVLSVGNNPVALGKIELSLKPMEITDTENGSSDDSGLSRLGFGAFNFQSPKSPDGSSQTNEGMSSLDAVAYTYYNRVVEGYIQAYGVSPSSVLDVFRHMIDRSKSARDNLLNNEENLRGFIQSYNRAANSMGSPSIDVSPGNLSSVLKASTMTLAEAENALFGGSDSSSSGFGEDVRFKPNRSQQSANRSVERRGTMTAYKGVPLAFRLIEDDSNPYFFTEGGATIADPKHAVGSEYTVRYFNRDSKEHFPSNDKSSDKIKELLSRNGIEEVYPIVDSEENIIGFLPTNSFLRFEGLADSQINERMPDLAPIREAARAGGAQVKISHKAVKKPNSVGVFFLQNPNGEKRSLRDFDLLHYSEESGYPKDAKVSDYPPIYIFRNGVAVNMLDAEDVIDPRDLDVRAQVKNEIKDGTPAIVTLEPDGTKVIVPFLQNRNLDDFDVRNVFNMSKFYLSRLANLSGEDFKKELNSFRYDLNQYINYKRESLEAKGFFRDDTGFGYRIPSQGRIIYIESSEDAKELLSYIHGNPEEFVNLLKAEFFHIYQDGYAYEHEYPGNSLGLSEFRGKNNQNGIEKVSRVSYWQYVRHKLSNNISMRNLYQGQLTDDGKPKMAISIANNLEVRLEFAQEASTMDYKITRGSSATPQGDAQGETKKEAKKTKESEKPDGESPNQGSGGTSSNESQDSSSGFSDGSSVGQENSIQNEAIPHPKPGLSSAIVLDEDKDVNQGIDSETEAILMDAYEIAARIGVLSNPNMGLANHIDAIAELVKNVDYPGIMPTQGYIMSEYFFNHIIMNEGDPEAKSKMYESLRDIFSRQTVKFTPLGKKRAKETSIDEYLKDLLTRAQEDSKRFAFNTKESKYADLLIDYIESLSDIFSKISSDEILDKVYASAMNKVRALEGKSIILNGEEVALDGVELGDQEHDFRSSLTSRIKKMLTGLQNKNSLGQPLVGILGIPQYVPYNDVYNVLESSLSYPIDLPSDWSELMRRLDEATKSYPWLTPLHSRLSGNQVPTQAKHELLNKFNRSYNTVLKFHKGKFIVVNDSNKLFSRIDDLASNLVRLFPDQKSILSFMSDLSDRRDKAYRNPEEEYSKQARYLIDKFIPGLPETILSQITEFNPTDVKAGDKKGYELRFSDGTTKIVDARFVVAPASKHFLINILTKMNKAYKDSGSSKEAAMEAARAAMIESHDFRALLTDALKHDGSSFSSSYVDAGKRLSSFSYTRLANEAINRIKYNQELRSKLLSSDYSKNSLWLRLLEMGHLNPESSDQINEAVKSAMEEYFMITPYSVDSSEEEGHYTKLSMEEKTKIAVAAYLDRAGASGSLKGIHKDIKFRWGRYTLPSMADKKQTFLMSVPMISDENLMDNNGQRFSLDSPEYKAAMERIYDFTFDQVVMPEVERILRLSSGERKTNVAGAQDIFRVFTALPGLNGAQFGSSKKDSLSVLGYLTSGNANRNTKVFQNAMNALKEAMKVEIAELSKEYVDILKDETQILKSPGGISLENISSSMSIDPVDDYVENYSDISISNVSLDLSEDNEAPAISKEDRDVRADETLMAINFLISATNLQQTVTGDAAFYGSDRKDLKMKGDDSSLIKVSKAGKSGRMLEVSDTSNVREIASNLAENLFSNFNKRMAMLTAQGNKLFDSVKEKYVQIALQDRKSMSTNFEYLLGVLSKTSGRDYLSQDDVKNALEQIKSQDPSTQKEGIEFFTSDDRFASISGFLESEASDAQEYVTAAEHLHIMYSRGHISDKDYKEIREKIQAQEAKMASGEPLHPRDLLDSSQLDLFLQPMKPVYTNLQYDENLGMLRPIYVKSSSFPLLPQLTAGLEIDHVRHMLETLQATAIPVDSSGTSQKMFVRASYGTANKLGAPADALDLWDINGRVNESLINLTPENVWERLSAHSMILERDGFRIQLDTPEHEHTIAIGTQIMKLLFGNGNISQDGFIVDKYLEGVNGESLSKSITGTELYQRFKKAIVDLIKVKEISLRRDFGIKEDGSVNFNQFISHITEVITEDAIENGATQNELSLIKAALSKATYDEFVGEMGFQIPIMALPNAKRYEQVIMSHVTKRIFGIRMPGYGYIAASERGFMKAKVKTSSMFTDDKGIASKIIRTKHYSDGRLTSAYEKDGKMIAAQVLVPSKFRDSNGDIIDLFEPKRDSEGRIVVEDGVRQYQYIVDKGTHYELNENVHEELLERFAFRIPTSSLISSANIVIAGFLPREAGDMIVVPDSFTTQKGMDFDVDKEYTYGFFAKEQIRNFSPTVSFDVIKRKSYSGDIKTEKDGRATWHLPIYSDDKTALFRNPFHNDVLISDDLDDEAREYYGENSEAITKELTEVYKAWLRGDERYVSEPDSAFTITLNLKGKFDEQRKFILDTIESIKHGDSVNFYTGHPEIDKAIAEALEKLSADEELSGREIAKIVRENQIDLFGYSNEISTLIRLIRQKTDVVDKKLVRHRSKHKLSDLMKKKLLSFKTKNNQVYNNPDVISHSFDLSDMDTANSAHPTLVTLDSSSILSVTSKGNDLGKKYSALNAKLNKDRKIVFFNSIIDKQIRIELQVGMSIENLWMKLKSAQVSEEEGVLVVRIDGSQPIVGKNAAPKAGSLLRIGDSAQDYLAFNKSIYQALWDNYLRGANGAYAEEHKRLLYAIGSGAIMLEDKFSDINTSANQAEAITAIANDFYDSEYREAKDDSQRKALLGKLNSSLEILSQYVNAERFTQLPDIGRAKVTARGKDGSVSWPAYSGPVGDKNSGKGIVVLSDADRSPSSMLTNWLSGLLSGNEEFGVQHTPRKTSLSSFTPEEIKEAEDLYERSHRGMPYTGKDKARMIGIMKMAMDSDSTFLVGVADLYGAGISDIDPPMEELFSASKTLRKPIYLLDIDDNRTWKYWDYDEKVFKPTKDPVRSRPFTPKITSRPAILGSKYYMQTERFFSLTNKGFYSDLVRDEFIKILNNDDSAQFPDEAERVYEEFSGSSRDLNSIDWDLKNTVAEIHMAMVQNPNIDIQAQMANTLSVAFAQSQVDVFEFARTANKNPGVSRVSPLSLKSQLTLMDHGSVGQMGIGVYSSGVVQLGLLQTAAFNGEPVVMAEHVTEKDPAKFPEGFQINSGKSLGFKLNFNEDPIGVIKRADGVLSAKTRDGSRSMADVLGERQNTATDNGKLNIMGKLSVTEDTIGIDTTAAMYGLDKFWAKHPKTGENTEFSVGYALTMFPGLSEMMQRWEEYQEQTWKMDEATRRQRAKNFFEFGKEEFRKKAGKAKIDTNAVPKINMDLYLEYLSNPSLEGTNEGMKSVILQNAFHVFALITELQRINREILSVNKIINTQSYKLGTSHQEAMDISAKLQASNNPSLKNFLDKYTLAPEMHNAAFSVLGMTEAFFNNIGKGATKLTHIDGIPEVQNEDIARAIIGYSHFKSITKYDPRSLITRVPEGNSQGLKPQDSLFDFIERIQMEPSNPLHNNAFIRDLGSVVTGTKTVHIKLKSLSSTNENRHDMMTAFLSLYHSHQVVGTWNGKTVTGRDLAEYLIDYSIIYSSPNVVGDFTSFIPYDAFIEKVSNVKRVGSLGLEGEVLLINRMFREKPAYIVNSAMTELKYRRGEGYVLMAVETPGSKKRTLAIHNYSSEKNFPIGSYVLTDEDGTEYLARGEAEPALTSEIEDAEDDTWTLRGFLGKKEDSIDNTVQSKIGTILSILSDQGVNDIALDFLPNQEDDRSGYAFNPQTGERRITIAQNEAGKFSQEDLLHEAVHAVFHNILDEIGAPIVRPDNKDDKDKHIEFLKGYAGSQRKLSNDDPAFRAEYLYLVEAYLEFNNQIDNMTDSTEMERYAASSIHEFVATVLSHGEGMTNIKEMRYGNRSNLLRSRTRLRNLIRSAIESMAKALASFISVNLGLIQTTSLMVEDGKALNLLDISREAIAVSMEYSRKNRVVNSSNNNNEPYTALSPTQFLSPSMRGVSISEDLPSQDLSGINNDKPIYC